MATQQNSNPPSIPNPTLPKKPVDQYMGETAVNPAIAQQAQFTPVQQQVGSGEILPSDAGQLETDAKMPVNVATGETYLAAPVTSTDPGTYQATTVLDKTPTTGSAVGEVSQEAVAAQGQVSDKSVADAPEGQTEGLIQQQDLSTRAIGDKEIAEAATADRNFLSDAQYQASQSSYKSAMEGATMEVTHDMTVPGQLANIQQDFESGKIPPYAAGIIRAANATMLQRGIGASSVAGAAITQAFIEASLPIAMKDAETYYDAAKTVMSNQQQANLENSRNNLQVELANLGNRQQMSLSKLQVEAALTGQELTNQQQVNVLNANKYSEAAGLNFTQEQNRVFANSKMIETMNLQNLSNEQAATLANAATYATMDMANLNARQQANITNAQSFLSMDMANLANEQKAMEINHASKQQSLLSDQASQNAAAQFNATSQNQTNQFFANLQQAINTHNSNEANAMSQFNAGQVNAMQQFSNNLQNQREQFETSNSMVIEQSNTQWRRNINTANTAVQNAANEINAQNAFNLSSTALSNIWQQFRDEADYVYNASENAADRAFNYAMAVLEAETTAEMFDKQVSHQNARDIGAFIMRLGSAAMFPDDTEAMQDALVPAKFGN